MMNRRKGETPAIRHDFAIKLRALAIASIAGCLAACGGGGNSAAPPPPVNSAPVVVSGTAAIGSAIAMQSVSARCAAGTGTATTDASGNFSITVANGQLPCVLEVGVGSDLLHSFALGSGSAATSNLSPLTQLLVAQTALQDPASYFSAFDATTAASLTTARVQAAQDVVQETLAAAGVNVGTFDWLTAVLIADSGGSGGNAYAQALDALAAALTAAGTTLATFTTVVVEQGVAVIAPNVQASLPAAMLLKPAAATCSVLRSGRYRVFTPTPGGALSAQFGIATIDASALSVARPDGSDGTWTPISACRFADSGGGWTGEIVVSQAGVWTGRYSLDGGATYKMLLAIPEQAHVVSELAGAWQQLGMDQAGAAFTPFAGSTTFDSSGAFAAGTQCSNDSTWAIDTCVTLTAPVLALLAPLQANADGGFDLADAATHTTGGRLFAYRSGGGYLMMVNVDTDGGFAIWTPQLAIALPDIGTVAYNFNFNIAGDLSVPTTEETTNTVTAVNAAVGSWTRVQQTIGAAFNYVTTLFANNPRDGFYFRPAGTVLASDGVTTVRLNEFTVMRVFGAGFAPDVIPAARVVQLSTGVPAP